MRNISVQFWVYIGIAVLILSLIIFGFIVNNLFGVFCEGFMFLCFSGCLYELSKNKKFMEEAQS